MRSTQQESNYQSKVLVTGAEGMLGRNIVERLKKEGYYVRALCYDRQTVEQMDKQADDILLGNILDSDFVSGASEGMDHIIHVAANTQIWPRRSEITRKVNVDGTRNIMHAALRHHITRLVHIGSASSFEHGSIAEPGNESNSYGGFRFKMDYLDSKYEAMKMLLKAQREKGLPVVVICPTFMIGPYDSGPSSGKLMISYYLNKLPGVSSGGKNFVFAGDVATAAVNALRLGKTGECYIAGNENLSYEEFFKKISFVTQRRYALLRLPSSLVLAAGVFNSVIARLSKRRLPLTYSTARFSLEKQYYDPSKAVRELMMPQTPISEAIRISLDWFKEKGYL